MINFRQTLNHSWFEWVFAFLVLLTLFPIPYHTVPSLDSSWQIVMEIAFFNEWQFGEDIIFTGGPLSFLYGRTTIGHFPRAQVFFEAILLFISLWTILYSTRGLSFWVRLLVVASLVAGAASTPDGVIILSIAAATICLIKNQAGYASILNVVLFFAVLSLVKFTLAILGILCLGILAGYKIWERKNNEAVLVIVGYPLAFSLIWVAVGQSIFNIPAFFIHSYKLSAGYAATMHMNEPIREFLSPLLLLCFTGIPLVWWIINSQRKPAQIAQFLVLAVSYFLAWKAGITRAGAHLAIVLQASALLPVLAWPMMGKTKFDHARILLGILLFYLSYFWLLPDRRTLYFSHLTEQIKFGVSYITSGGGNLKDFTKLIPQIKSDHKLENICAYVGNASIDVLNFHNGVLILNDLNYHPRPTIQNYLGLNDHLTQWNQKHMREDPPQFILCRDGSVDSRYPGSDDNLFFREVLENYSPVLNEDEYLLLERKDKEHPYVSEKTVIKSKVARGEMVDISQYSDNPLWLRVQYRQPILHKVIAFFHKPEILYIIINTNAGETHQYRLVSSNLENGILLNPKLDTNKDIQDFLDNGKLSENISSFSLFSKSNIVRLKTQEFEIEVIQLKREQSDP